MSARHLSAAAGTALIAAGVTPGSTLNSADPRFAAACAAHGVSGVYSVDAYTIGANPKPGKPVSKHAGTVSLKLTPVATAAPTAPTAPAKAVTAPSVTLTPADAVTAGEARVTAAREELDAALAALAAAEDAAAEAAAAEATPVTMSQADLRALMAQVARDALISAGVVTA